MATHSWENPRDGGAWWAAIYGITQSQTRPKWLSSSSRKVSVMSQGRKWEIRLYRNRATWNQSGGNKAFVREIFEARETEFNESWKSPNLSEPQVTVCVRDPFLNHSLSLRPSPPLYTPHQKRAIPFSTGWDRKYMESPLPPFFLAYSEVKVRTPYTQWNNVLSRFSCVWLFAIPWTVARQASLSMGCSRQEDWSGLPFKWNNTWTFKRMR